MTVAMGDAKHCVCKVCAYTMKSTERMERKSRERRNWMAVSGISKEQFDETATN